MVGGNILGRVDIQVQLTYDDLAMAPDSEGAERLGFP